MGVFRNSSARRTPSHGASSLPMNTSKPAFNPKSALAIGLSAAALITLFVVAASQSPSTSAGLNKPEATGKDTSATVNQQTTTQPTVSTNQPSNSDTNSISSNVTTNNGSVNGSTSVSVDGTNVTVPPNGTTTQTIPISGGDATVNVSHTSSGDSTNVSSTTTTENISGDSNSTSSINVSSNLDTP